MSLKNKMVASVVVSVVSGQWEQHNDTDAVSTTKEMMINRVMNF